MGNRKYLCQVSSSVRKPTSESLIGDCDQGFPTSVTARREKDLLCITQCRQDLPELLAIVTAHGEFFAVHQLHHVIAMRQGTKFTQTLDVDDGAAVNADKLLRIQLSLQLVH